MAKVVDIVFQVLDKASAPLERMRASLAESNRQWTRAGQQIERTGRRIQNVGAGLTKSITVPLVGAGTMAVNKFAEVDKTMALVKGTMGEVKFASGDLNKYMSEAAANSTFGMKDAAEAALNFARGGKDAAEAGSMLAPAMNLAAGAGGDLQTVSSGLMATMNSFGADAREASKYADVFANACSGSALDVNSLSNAMSIAGPIFKTGGLGVKDAALAMGLMANKGVEAGVGANALKTGMARLASPAKEAAAWMERLHINAFKENGQMKDMASLQGELSRAFSTLSAQEKEAAASAIFGKNQMAPWLSLIGTAPKDVDKLSDALNKQKTAASMAKGMMEGFGGSIEKLKSSFDVFMTNMGKPIGEVLTPFINKVQGVIDKLNSLDDTQKKQLVKFAMMAAAAGPVIFTFGKITTGVGAAVKMVGTFGKIAMKLPSVGAAFASTAGAVGGLKGLLLGAGKALVTLVGPAGIVVGVLAGIAVAAVLVWKNWDKVKVYGQKAFKALTPVINAFKAVAVSMKNTLVTCFNNIKKAVVSAVGPIVARIKSIMKHFSELAQTPAFQKFVTMLEQRFVTKIKTALMIADAIFTTVFTTITGVVSGAISGIGGYIEGLMQIFDGLIQFLTGVFTGNWRQAWEGIKDIFRGAFDALVGLAKVPLNSVIALINGAISGINKINVSIPQWVPKYGGQSFSANIPTIPQLARGTSSWGGGVAMINERGGEIVDLPRGSRVYPHDKSIEKARKEGKSNITIAKLADSIIIREEADIERLASSLVHKLEIYQSDYAYA